MRLCYKDDYFSLLITGKDTPPALSLYSRNREGKAEITPAPGDYNPEKATSVILDTSPKYTFGMRTQVEKRSETPGKNKCFPTCAPKKTPPKCEKSHAILIEI